MSAKTRRFVPRLECFDERALPSVSYDLQGGVLFVHGDAAANQITISDNGSATGVSVTSNDGTSWSNPTGATITSVFVDSQGGDDTVVYNLNVKDATTGQPAPMTVNRLVDVDLGVGNDSYTANISGQSLAAYVNLDLSGHGHGGKDTMILNAQNVSTAPGSVLNVDFSGDAGKDTMAFNYSAGIDASGMVVFTKDQKH
jgi:hypothetical protein